MKTWPQPLESHGPLLGWVVDREDELQLGRVRLLIPDVLGREVTSDWAEPLTGGVPALTAGDVRLGGLFVPPLGARVQVFFAGGNVARPRYLHGGYHTKNTKPAMEGQGDGRLPPRALGEVGTAREEDSAVGAVPTSHQLQSPPEPFAGVYPDNASFRLPGGFLVEFDATEGSRRFKITHPSGWVFEVDEQGRGYVKFAGKVFEVYEEVVERIYKKGLHETVEDGGASFKVAKGDRAVEVVEGENHETYRRKSTETFEDERAVTVKKKETRKYEEGVEWDTKGEAKLDFETLKLAAEQELDVHAKATLKLTADGATTLTLRDVTGTATGIQLTFATLTLQGVATLNGRKLAKDGDRVVGDVVRAT